MQADKVEIRQVGMGTKIGEGVFVQLCARAGGCSNFLRENGLCWVEIGAVPLNAGCSGDDVDAHALPEAEFAGSTDFWCGQSGIEQCKFDA